LYTYKVMIHPNNKQETKIRRTLNKCIECNNIIYDYLDSFLKAKLPFPKCSDVRKWFTIQKKVNDDITLEKRKGMTKKEIIENHLDTLFYDVSNDALKQEVKDTYNSFVKFFKKLAKYPTKKQYHSYRKSFYVDPFKIEFTTNKVKLEKITSSTKENRRIINYINLAEKDRIPTNSTYYNPRVVLEGDRFYIVVAVEDNPNSNKYNVPLTNEVIGIDLNVAMIVTSDDNRYKSVTKEIAYKKANKKLKKETRKLSRKYEDHKKTHKKLRECKNYQKQKKIKRKYQQRINNIKKEHDELIITSITNKLPKSIHIEDLNIKGMQCNKNKDSKYIRKGIQQNGWRNLINRLKNKCSKYKIEILEIDRWYPSSKKCHRCGNIKQKLLLSERTYNCDICGLKINRDLNAAINIKNYSI